MGERRRRAIVIRLSHLRITLCVVGNSSEGRLPTSIARTEPGRRVPPFVADASENYSAAVDNLPIFRDPEFHASKNGVCFQSGLLALHLGIPEIDFACSEDRGALGAMEILRGDVALHTAKHRCFTFANMIRQINERH